MSDIICYCNFDENDYYNYDNDDYDDNYDDNYDDDYDDNNYDADDEVFLTDNYEVKKDWFCCNCYSLFESKSDCLKHEKICIKFI